MKYDIRQEEAKLFVHVEGELDTRTSPEFERAFFPALKGIKETELNLDRLDYLSSAGLRVLLGAAKTLEEAGGSLVVKNVGENVMDVLRVTGFDEVLTIE